MNKSLKKPNSSSKTLVFIVCAILGFIVFNLIANGIFALKDRFQKTPTTQQTVEATPENP